MITHKFSSKYRARLRNFVTSFHEKGFTAFDYSAYPLQAYICYGIGLEEEKPTFFQNKLCKQGHIWQDTILSSRYTRKPNDCYICKMVMHTRDINSGEYAARRNQRYHNNPDAHNADCLKRYHQDKERILKRCKLKAKETKEAVLKGELPRFYNGKTCKKCNLTLKYTCGNNCVNCAKQKARQYAIENAEKVYEHHRLYNAVNPERAKAWRDKWIQENPDKAREFSNRRYERVKTALKIGYTKEELVAHLEMFSYQCAYCKEALSLKAKNGWHLDHFIALSKDGNNHLGNYVPACRRCNQSKHDKHPQEWYSQQNFFDADRWKEILSILWQYQEKYGLYEESILELIKAG